MALNIIKQLIIIGENIIKDTKLIEAIKLLKVDSLSESFTINIGDTVVVRKQMKAKVVEISTSNYGCRKYKVTYIEKEGIWNLSFEDEWFLIKDLIKISSLKN